MQRSRRICHDTVSLAKEILAWTNCQSCLLKKDCNHEYHRDNCLKKIQTYLNENTNEILEVAKE